MGVLKDKERGTYTVRIRYKDINGDERVHKKRGFRLQREAKEYEAEYLRKLGSTTNMTFASFVEIYMADVWPTLKRSTQLNRENVIQTKFLPTFGRMKLQDIKPRDIIKWQNMLIMKRDENGNGYSPVYLRKIRSNLNAIFNHAERYYDLKDNPAKKVRAMGKQKGTKVAFWEMKEYQRFRECAKEKPEAFYAFETLFWTGMRIGELLALTKKDIDLEKMTINVDKTYKVEDGEENITEPKTELSVRVIDLPEILRDELEDFLAMFYALPDDARPFNKSEGFYQKQFKSISKKAGVKEIKIHALRHSHISYLLASGFTPVEVGDRTGQDAKTITENYAHAMPSKKSEMVNKLQSELGQIKEAEISE